MRMTLDKLKLHDVREILHRWGYVVLEDQGPGLPVTNGGNPKREVCHQYPDLDRLKQFMFIYRETELDKLYAVHEAMTDNKT